MNVATQQTDIYSHERATLREHLEILNGRTTWREPVPHGTRVDSVPYEHTLAAAIAFAREKLSYETATRPAVSDDVGPDILEALVYRRPVATDRVVTTLVTAVRDMSASMRRVDISILRRAAFLVLSECVTGIERDRPQGMRAHDWAPASALMIRLIWASAGQTIQRAGEALQ